MIGKPQLVGAEKILAPATLNGAAEGVGKGGDKKLSINEIIYPEDWEEVILSMEFEEILERFGLGYVYAIASPARILALMARVSYDEFSYQGREEFSLLNPVKFARLGDSNAENVKRMRILLPLSTPSEKTVVKIKEGRINEEIGFIITPPRLDYDARQIGEAPMGLGGKFVTGAKVLPKANEQILQMAQETENYFNIAKYGAGFEISVASLGGTEVLNLASKVHQKVKPQERISIWIVDRNHPNLKPLLAYRLKAGFKRNELRLLRVNEGRLLEGDIALARALCGLLVQFGQRGKPDVSTIIRTFTDKYYEGFVTYSHTEVKVPCFPLRVERRMKYLRIPRGSRTVVRKSSQMTRIIGEKIGELSSRGSKESYYFVLGSFKSHECEEIEDKARSYVRRDQITAIPCGSRIESYGNNYHFMTVTIVRFSDGYRILKDVFNCADCEKIPDEVLESIINDKRSNDVTKGLEMASKYLGLDVFDFIRGGEDEK